ncbi:MAG TPA: DNA-processing protein DprA [Polyangiaceae bacterium]|nr:DNA-processing protein DprA [Polyangiaceae bacterium]
MGSSSGTARVLEGAQLPPRLADLAAPPLRLYLHGELPRGPAVAIVGTRRASPEGLSFTRGLASELAAAGVAVLSGGAEGIDTAAHEGALDAGGVTVVVAPAGFARPYPKENAVLFQRVVTSGGTYLSLVPDQVPATSAIFFARNACLMALAHAVIMTETPVAGGTSNASKWARELGRPLFVVPHSPWHWQGKGCIEQIRLGARPVHGAREVLDLLEASGLRSLGARPVQCELPLAKPISGMDPVLEALRSGACHADEIAERTGLSVVAVQQRILTLALSGVLVPGPWGSLKLVTY